jgi:UPF0716 protein FxsA
MIRAGRRTLAVLLLVFVVLPIVEIWLLVLLGQQIGALPVLGLVLAETLVGIWLIRRRWRAAWESLRERSESPGLAAMDRSRSDAVDTAVFVAGGVALIFPGLITDLIALICLIPFTRSLPRRLVDRWLDRRLSGLPNLGFPNVPARGASGDVIEGEVVDDPATRSDRPRDEPLVIRGEIDDR